MNILFTSLHFGEAAFYCKIAKKLKDININSYHISFSKKAETDIKKLGENIVCFKDLLNEINKRYIRDDEAFLREVEERYDLVNLKEIYLADRALIGKSEKNLVRETIKYLFTWEHYLTNVKVDCIITDLGGELIRRTIKYVANKLGIPIIFTNWISFTNSLSLTMDDYYQLDKKVISKKNLLSENDKLELNEFIEENRPRLSTSFVCSPRPEINWSRIYKYIKHCYIYFVIEKCNHEHFNKCRHAITLIKRIRNKRLLVKLYSKPDLNDKYIYFPFHAADDFQLTVRERHCLDQYYLVNLFADSIPPGYKLYVKEHPDSIGVMSYKMLKKIARREGVVILPPTISSQTLVKHAKAVITINSTVGFESLLLFKPVIVLGWPYYRGFGVTIDVDSFRDFPKVIKRALKFKVDKEKLNNLLYTVRNLCFEGRPYVFEEDLSNENIEKVTKSILLKLNRIGLINDKYIR